MNVNFRYPLTISLVTAPGGLPFGFNISENIPFILISFCSNEFIKAWVVSSAIIVYILGACYDEKPGKNLAGKNMLLIGHA
ncbi:hypothetical protein GM418_07560 [Maribellus comscasis]|uniref:Uncharacterized protein n=1 Tax=Maribellus comscasis TaxID=2681766 RepID=A0A6I6JMC3_9BACT|nr:hypothetical protein [Maribellus comscasis]QGY43521.1 hypothetical protein GM418_07560 [Maribellus comscasis]